MFGLKLSGQIMQVLAIVVVAVGIFLGGIALLSGNAISRGGGAALIGYALGSGFVMYLIGGAAQALAVIAENSDYQVRLLAKLAKELPPSNRQLKQEQRQKNEPLHRKLERQAKDL